jgi:hypothetical protein
VLWAFDLDLLDWVGEAADDLNQALRAPFFDSYLGFFIGLAGLWAVWHGLARRRALQAVEGIAWTVFVVTLALVFMAKPGAILDGIGEATTGLARGAYEIVSGVSPQPDLDDGITERAEFGADGTDAELRRTADRLWRSSTYVPWAILELGSGEVAKAVAPGQELTYGERLLHARTFSEEELDRLRAGTVTYDELRGEKLMQLAAIRDDLQRDHPDALPWLSGQRAGERVGIAALSFVAAVLFGALLLAAAGAVVLTQLALLLVAATAPIFLVLGVVPGRGRVLTMRWLELLMSLVLKRVIAGVVLAVVLELSGALMAATSTLGWGITVALQIGLVACVVVYRKPFVSLFGSMTLPVTGAGVRLAADAAGVVVSPTWRQSVRPSSARRRDERPVVVRDGGERAGVAVGTTARSTLVPFRVARPRANGKGTGNGNGHASENGHANGNGHSNGNGSSNGNGDGSGHGDAGDVAPE